MLSADRQSLVAEVRDLRAQLQLSGLEKRGDRSKLSDQLHVLEDQFDKRERQLKRQRKYLQLVLFLAVVGVAKFHLVCAVRGAVTRYSLLVSDSGAGRVQTAAGARCE